MRNENLPEIIFALILIVLLVLVLNPLDLWMPSSLAMVITVGLIVFFAIFAGFVWRENIRDERENLHRMMASRLAFLAGATVLLVGIVVESFNHDVDPWLVATLGIMILTKVVGFIYSRAIY